MSRQIKFHQPLKNITASLNSNMSFHQHSDSGLYNLNNSPMSALAFNLSELSTGRNTPRLRRRLSLSSIDTPTNDGGKLDSGSTFSAESGCFSESPLENSPTFDSLNMKRYATAFHPDIPLEAFSVKKKTIAFRRINSQPLPAMRRLDSPTDFLEEVKEDSGDNNSGDARNENIPNDDDDETSLAGNFRNKFNSEDAISQDSGLGSDQDMRSSVSSFDSLISSSSLTHYDRLPSLEDVWNSMDSPSFKTPKGMPPKRHHTVTEDAHYSEETCSPIKYSPVKSSSMPKPSFSKDLFHLQEDGNEVTDEQKPEADDGFQELFKLNDVNGVLEDRVSSLVSHTLLLEHPRTGALGMSNKDVRTCSTKPAICSNNSVSSSHPFVVRRSLYRSQSLDIRSRPSSKRCEPPADDNTPVQCKRWRGEVTAIKEKTVDEDSNKLEQSTRFQRSHSEVETIKYAVSLMLAEPDLIGDCSKAYCLPTVSGKHQDLKSITPQTLSRLMANEFSNVVEEFHIIDCRYPYEYEGGHIQNAINIYTKDAVVAKYLKSPLSVKDTNKRIILVFHCEFSSERGPGLFRFLRGKDRETNKEFYPFLHYPEIYLLEGGYKSFFENYSHLCEPRTYKTMHDKNHCEDLRRFRAKSKMWSDDKTQPRPGVRNLKF